MSIVSTSSKENACDGIIPDSVLKSLSQPTGYFFSVNYYLRYYRNSVSDRFLFVVKED